jgi:hypothetical protein
MQESSDGREEETTQLHGGMSEVSGGRTGEEGRTSGGGRVRECRVREKRMRERTIEQQVPRRQ